MYLQFWSNAGRVGLTSILHVLISHGRSKQSHRCCWHPLRHVPYIAVVGCCPTARWLSLAGLLSLLTMFLLLLCIGLLWLSPTYGPTATTALVASARAIPVTCTLATAAATSATTTPTSTRGIATTARRLLSTAARRLRSTAASICPSCGTCGCSCTYRDLVTMCMRLLLVLGKLTWQVRCSSSVLYRQRHKSSAYALPLRAIGNQPHDACSLNATRIGA